MEYFGKYWGAPVCDSCQHTETPVGQICFWCEESIGESDRGFLVPHASWKYMAGQEKIPPVQSIHLECMIRMTVGSLGHLRKTCSCYGGNEEDPPNMTKREAAIAAYREFSENEGTAKR